MSDILRLKNIRKERNFTTRELSNLTGVSSSYITELETGRYDNPGLVTICLLCKGLGITPNDLIPNHLYK